LIPVGFGYGDEDEFFLRGWVWDSETRPRPAPLPSLGHTVDLFFQFGHNIGTYICVFVPIFFNNENIFVIHIFIKLKLIKYKYYYKIKY